MAEAEIVRKCLGRTDAQVRGRAGRPRRRARVRLAAYRGDRQGRHCGRRVGQCSFLEYKNHKIVYRRYASLFFIVGIDSQEVRPWRRHRTRRVGGHGLT